MQFERDGQASVLMIGVHVDIHKVLLEPGATIGSWRVRIWTNEVREEFYLDNTHTLEQVESLAWITARDRLKALASSM